MLRVCLLFAILCAVGGELRAVTVNNDDVKSKFSIGTLSPLNGTWVGGTEVSLGLPTSECKNGWTIGSGYRGQSSTVFPTNGTWFILGQTECSQQSNTTLFGVLGPFEGRGPARVYFASELGHHWNHEPLENFFINWDWTCNIVVQAPRRNGTHEMWHTLQVSEYDGQIRPQAAVVSKICTAEDEYCWRRVPGFSAMDTGGSKEPGIWDPELNCGDKCAVVTHEELMMNGKPQKPMNLVGRSFRTGKVMYNVTDPVQVQTLTFASAEYFVGLGICCAEEYCLKECHKHDGMMVMFAWNPTADKWFILDVLGEGEMAMKTAARLGINPLWSYDPKKNAPNTLVLWKDRIHGWKVDLTSSPPKATLASVSHKVSPVPFAWATSDF